jgi:hypothetical protein
MSANAKFKMLKAYNWTITDGGIENPPETTSPLILTYNCSAGDYISLPLYETVNVRVYWGDGFYNEYTTYGTYSYRYLIAGTYTVKIYGTLGQFGYGANSVPNVEKLISVESFGEIGLYSLSGAFYNAVNLVSVPATLPTTTAIISLYHTFYNTTSFDQDLGDWNISGVQTMENMFNNVSLSIANYDSLLIGWSQLALSP